MVINTLFWHKFSSGVLHQFKFQEKKLFIWNHLFDLILWSNPEIRNSPKIILQSRHLFCFLLTAALPGSGCFFVYNSTWSFCNAGIFICCDSADIVAWRLCDWERKTRSTARMKSELWPPSTRRRGGRGRAKSCRASGRWCTEKPKARRRSKCGKQFLFFTSNRLPGFCFIKFYWNIPCISSFSSVSVKKCLENVLLYYFFL